MRRSSCRNSWCSYGSRRRRRLIRYEGFKVRFNRVTTWLGTGAVLLIISMEREDIFIENGISGN